MAYYRFCYGPGDTMTDVAGNAVSGWTINVYTAETAGSLVTDLREPDDTPLPGQVVTSSAGRYPFKAPDTQPIYWLDDGQNERWMVGAIEVFGQAASASDLATAAAADAEEALEAATSATIAVDELEDLIGASTAINDALIVVTDDAYGAVGNGTADDGPAIQAALNEANSRGGGVVIFPGGKTFRIDDPVRIGSHTRLSAYGAQVISGTGEPLLYSYTDAENVVGTPGYSLREHITIEGGVWDMRSHLLGSADIHNAMTFAHMRNLSIRDVTVRNVKGYHAIEIHACQNTVIQSCRFEGYQQDDASFPREAIQVDMVNMTFDDGSPVDGLVVRDCYCGPSDDCGAWGRFIGSHTTGAVAYRGIQVLNNQIEDTLDFGICGMTWSHSLIQGNRVTDSVDVGIGVVASGLAPNDLIIADNVIENPGGNGIAVTSADNGTTRYSRVIVRGNQTRSSGSNGIYCAGVNRLVVANNTVDETAANNCIQVGDAATGGCLSPLITGNWVNLATTNGIGVRSAPGAYVHGNKVCQPGGNPINITGSTRVSVLFNDTATRADGTTANSKLVAGTKWLGCNTSTIAITAPATTGASAFPITETLDVVNSGSNIIG